ncbi:hypothetical protein GJ496_000934 [Pomphorhynchus laevis]|nr:hypothetical protein GJ496_000934 [Pomphorhynchus laevis]
MVNGSINQPFSTNSSMPWCGGVSSMATNRFVDCSSDNMNRQISGQIEKCNNSSLQQRSPTSSSILTADVAAASASHRMGNVKRNNSVKEAASAKELKEMNIQYDMVEHPTLHNAKESASDKQHEYVGMNDNYEQSISKTVRELKEMDLRDQDEVPQTVYNYKYQGDMQMGQERHKHILNPSVRSALIKNPKYRSIKDKFIIADYMKLLDPIKNLSISATRLISNKNQSSDTQFFGDSSAGRPVLNGHSITSQISRSVLPFDDNMYVVSNRIID